LRDPLRRLVFLKSYRQPYRRAVLYALLCLLSMLTLEASAQVENSVKAAFVFNFLRFTEWPAQRFANREAALTLCVWSGNTPLTESLGNLAGRTVDQRSLRVSNIDRVDDLNRCHALFLPEAAQHGLSPGLLRRAEAQDVLTVGDAEGFAVGGGMIGLVVDGTRMRFEINDRAVKRSAIKLSSQLYQLGRPVQEGVPR
jgi:hypothetical protein